VADAPRVGVLAYQGDVREHLAALEAVGAVPVEVRTLAELEAVEGLVVPGGESTVIGKLAARYGLLEPLRQRAAAGLPVFGTCAGMIFLAREVEGPPQDLLGVLDVRVRRNAFGRQVASFEAEMDVKGVDGGPVAGAFIRAPWVADAALMMQLGADGVFVGSGIFKSGDPARRARAIVEATTFFRDPEIVAKVSRGLGEPMVGIAAVPEGERLADRGW